MEEETWAEPSESVDVNRVVFLVTEPEEGCSVAPISYYCTVPEPLLQPLNSKVLEMLSRRGLLVHERTFTESILSSDIRDTRSYLVFFCYLQCSLQPGSFMVCFVVPASEAAQESLILYVIDTEVCI